jgi:hypothetical protein
MNDRLAQLQDDAVNVLQDALLWELSPARWDGIAAVLQALEALEADLGQGDVDALTEAVAQLELAGPVRITRIGAPPVEPPPPKVRERINQLIHRLSRSRA